MIKNNLMRNLLRLYTSQYTPLVRMKCTAQEAAAVLQSEEPDKLFKKIEIEMRCADAEVMKSYGMFIKMAAANLDVRVGKCWTPFKPHFGRDNLTLLRSAFVKKKCRVQYEVRTYFRYMNLHHLTGSTADTFLEYIERNLPEGVAMKVTKVECEKIPEDLTSHVSPEDQLHVDNN